MQIFHPAPVPLLATLFVLICRSPSLIAASPKVHTVTLGTAKKVPYTPPGATPQSAHSDPLTLKVRSLIVDGRQREWTTGDAHDVTDRSFTIRRALHINDKLPDEAADHWVWQPGPWLLVDRATGHIAALHLPDFDPIASDAVWFRDYAAYCGIATTAKGGLYAIVAQLGVRKAVVSKQLAKWPQPDSTNPIPPCQPAIWQRDPMRVTLHLTGSEPVTFDVVGSASIVEEGDLDEP